MAEVTLSDLSDHGSVKYCMTQLAANMPAGSGCKQWFAPNCD